MSTDHNLWKLRKSQLGTITSNSRMKEAGSANPKTQVVWQDGIAFALLTAMGWTFVIHRWSEVTLYSSISNRLVSLVCRTGITVNMQVCDVWENATTCEQHEDTVTLLFTLVKASQTDWDRRMLARKLDCV